MKKTILAAMAFMLCLSGFAQNEKMYKAIEPKLSVIDTTRSITELVELAGYFDRICNAEPAEWLPLYYKALCHIRIGYIYSDAGKLDMIDAQTDEAEKYLDKAQAIEKNNSEIFCLRKMVATLRIVVDPMSRFPTYTPIGDAAINQAEQLNPENPRIYLLKGIDKYHIPEQYGGSKTEAKSLFETTFAKFKAFKTQVTVSPQWGLQQAKYFYSMVSK